MCSLKCPRSSFPLFEETLTENKVNIEEDIAKRYREKWNCHHIIWVSRANHQGNQTTFMFSFYMNHTPILSILIWIFMVDLFTLKTVFVVWIPLTLKLRAIQMVYVYIYVWKYKYICISYIYTHAIHMTHMHV